MPDASQASRVTDLSDTAGTPGFWDRLRGAFRYALTGDFSQGWFPPLNPIQPIVPDSQKPSVEGRQLDYVVGSNIRYTPRSEELISFQTMRQLAHSDLLSIIINGRKDQLAKLEWSIEPRDTSKRKTMAAQAIELENWWRKPDQRHTWREWLSMLLDDLLVIDAPCLFVRRDRTGVVWGFDPIDGSTIKPLIDLQGHRPIPPLPAYSQVLHGTPAIWYTHDQMVYKPRVLRTSHLYGYSPIERVILTVNVALRRQVQQLDHFTEGSMPHYLLSVPKEWTAEQIESFQARWDARFSGNLAERARTHFIPDGIGTHEFKKIDLKDEFDEWLARVQCAAYGVDPTPFIKQVNRGTQETTREAALAEGLAPYQVWISELVDDCLERMGFADFRHNWKDDEAIDPVEKSTIIKNKIAAGALHPNEARAEDGLDPLDDQTIAWLFAMQRSPTPVPSPAVWQDGQPPPAQTPPASPPVASTSAQGGGAAAPHSDDEHASGGAAAGKGAAANGLGKARAPARIDRDRRLVKTATERLSRALTKTLRKMAPDIAKQIADRLPERKKASGDRLPDDIAQALDLAAMDGMVSAFESGLATVAKDGARMGLDQVGVELDLDSPNEDAERWARTRAAELVGKRYNEDGDLVDNPRAEFAITDGTRSHVRGLVASAIDEGWSNDTLAANLKASYAFSAARADVIARTETARADVAGNLIGWQASGVVERKQWIVGDDCCPECCDLDGVEVDIDESFPGEGGDGPPLHPACRCDISPVVTETEAA
jgi:SPP1 gp7 family putative phage head morphogenesis protein